MVLAQFCIKVIFQFELPTKVLGIGQSNGQLQSDTLHIADDLPISRQESILGRAALTIPR
jgi:SAM-dependent MidA family methyltransferase